MHPGWGLLCAALRASVYMGARAAKRSGRGHYYALRGHREYILCVYGGGGILQTIKTSVTTHVTRHPHRTPVRGPTPGPTLTLEYRAQPVTLIDPAAPSLSLSLPSLHLPHPDRALLVIYPGGVYTALPFTQGKAIVVLWGFGESAARNNVVMCPRVTVSVAVPTLSVILCSCASNPGPSALVARSRAARCHSFFRTHTDNLAGHAHGRVDRVTGLLAQPRAPVDLQRYEVR